MVQSDRSMYAWGYSTAMQIYTMPVMLNASEGKASQIYPQPRTKTPQNTTDAEH